jgi:cobalamin synthase
MEKFWNIIHFFAYKLDYKLTIFLYKYTAFKFYDMPFMKRRCEKTGQDPKKAVIEVFKDPRFGFSSFFAYGTMIAIPFVFLFGLQLYYAAFISKSVMNEYFFIVLFAYSIPCALLNYFLLLHKDKYLKYFRLFEKQPRAWKVKWAWISAVVILFPFLVLIGSFIVNLPK